MERSKTWGVDVMDSEKMSLQSMDVAKNNREQLKQLFPSVFVESLDEGGNLVESIDFEKLKAELGTFSDLFEGRRERYGLDWPGKTEALKIIQKPSVATLKPERDQSVNFDSTKNLFIEGDNLEVLKLLQKSYYGKIKMIYIDPPYNTGNEFVYPDNYSESLETYLTYAGLTDDDGKRFSTNTQNEGRYHTKWLNMIYPRLYLARNLLTEDGVIFISIDDHEVKNLWALCDEVFGEDNILGTIANVNNPKGRSDDNHLATAHEYIVVVAKNSNLVRLHGFEPEHKVLKRYNKSDGAGRKYREIDLRKTGDEDRRVDREDMFYYFYFNPDTGCLRVSKTEDKRGDDIEIIPLREDGVEGRWRWGYTTAKRNLGVLVPKFMPQRKQWGIFEKDYLDNRKAIKPTTAWTFKDVNSERGSEQFVNLGFDKEVFSRPKPVGTLSRLLKIGTVPGEPCIVLDFFAGSCSFAHAVLEETKKSGEKISFVLVQLPERLDPNSKKDQTAYEFCESIGKSPTIAEIGKERIRRVINQIVSEQDEARTEAANAIPGLDEGVPELDLGFKVLKLDQSNFKIWDGSNPEISEEELQKQLELHIDHIDPNSSEEDILYELLLKAGYMPTVAIEKREMAGKSIYSVDDGTLLICLEDEITKELIMELAKAEPRQVICLDQGFNHNDQLKANAVQTFSAQNEGKDKSEQIVFRTV